MGKKSSSTIILYFIFLIMVIFVYFNKDKPSVPTSLNQSSTNVDIVFKPSHYTIDYSSKTNKNLSFEISHFQQDEPWYGNFQYEPDIFIEGQTSISLYSRNGEQIIINLNKKLNLKGMKFIKLLIYSTEDYNEDNIKNFTIRFTNLEEKTLDYLITSTFKKGWNVLSISKENFEINRDSLNNFLEKEAIWENILNTRIELTSRQNSKVELMFNRLWSENNESYFNKFIPKTNSMLSWKQYGKTTLLNVFPIGGTLISIKEVTLVNDFIYTVKLIPETIGTFGIVARLDYDNSYGYYLLFNGIDTNTFRIAKKEKFLSGIKETTIATGKLFNAALEKNKPLWLKIETKGKKIICYLSIDGKMFNKLAEIQDDDFKSGRLGIYTEANILIDKVAFQQ